jgi:dCMP deaminase
MVNPKKYIQSYSEFAKAVASWSHDPKTKVGTVIVSEDYREVYAIGYNGTAIGLSNERLSDEAGQSGMLHSEINALICCKAPRESKKIVFTTHSPCRLCATALINLGNVSHVYYNESYGSEEGLSLLKQAWIPCILVSNV